MHSALRNPGHELSDALDYVNAHGFPLFCKPNMGARGDYAEIITSCDNFEEYVTRVSTKYDTFLIENLIKGDEYRVLMYDDKAIYYALKHPPHLIGNGKNTVSFLLDEFNEKLRGMGISTYSISSVVASGFSASYVPKCGEHVIIVGRQNLSALADLDKIETIVPSQIHQLAYNACQSIGLRIGAVDIFDVSINRDLTDLVVIEVNGNPALKALENAGHLSIIVNIWKSMIIDVLVA